MKRYILTFLGVLTICSSIIASHNRAGEITYTHISGNTYQIIVTIYTKPSSNIPRPDLPIFFGDGTPQELIPFNESTLLGNDVEERIYRMQHTFPGSGSYEICVVDPNRNGLVINIFDSYNTLFALKTVLRISPLFVPHNSIVFTNRPIQDACLNQPWIHNPGAVYFGGDSIAFHLVPCLGQTENGCEPLPFGNFEFPDQYPVSPNNQLDIDLNTGTITWDSPQQAGLYNIAILVEEWNKGIFLGSVLRDMQITVQPCDNLPPELEAIRDTCIEAGQTLSLGLSVSDPLGNQVTLSGYGSAFAVSSSPASISQSIFEVPTDAMFNWQTNCSHVRANPYMNHIQATNNGAPIGLVAIETFNITVVAPAPENLEATAIGSSIALTWEPSICTQAVGYRLYRRINPYGFVPDNCETGVPAYTGYELIADINGLDNTSYLDDDEIIFGRQNCYLVIAYFSDGAESYAGIEACAEIRFEIPIIKKNSIGITAPNGVDTVAWRSPIELDLEIFPGPYQYRLLRSPGYEAATDVVLETPVENDIDALTTNFISAGLNTEDTAHTYRVELYSGGVMAARSNLASSLFIELIPNDNQIEVTWREETPWINFRYDIYRQEGGAGDFELIGNTDEVGYLDTALVNNRTYCYYIVSHGSYFAIEEADTLINFSQRTCSQPYDRTPPCPPVLELDGDCVDYTIDMEWTNPNLECDETDDTMLYHIYFSPTEGGEFELLEVLQGDYSTTMSYVFDNSIAGCYAVTALDSLGLWPDGELRRNESEFSNIICVDNCPEYSLPNVFTPNGDGRNDILLAFPYRSVESVEFTLFNRWGSIVFETTDPDIRWDGRNKETGEIVSSSTYFYTCRVFTIRLSGLEPLDLTGNIQVFSREGGPNE